MMRNILRLALKAIPSTPVTYFHCEGTETADDGSRISLFNDPVRIACGTHIQPLDRSRYDQYGLSFQRSYWQWYVAHDVTGVDRGTSGDVIEYQGRRLQVSSDVPWYAIGGFDVATLIDIGPSTGNTSQPCIQR